MGEREYGGSESTECHVGEYSRRECLDSGRTIVTVISIVCPWRRSLDIFREYRLK
jgi:hypothetical protein